MEARELGIQGHPLVYNTVKASLEYLNIKREGEGGRKEGREGGQKGEGKSRSKIEVE